MSLLNKAVLVLAAAAASAAGAQAEDKSAREQATVIMPENPGALEFQNEVGFSDAIITGDTIYLSGVVAGPVKEPKDMTPAFERAFARIETVLKRAGASWDDVVDITTYHTDLAGQVGEFVAVKNRYVKAPFPTWTAIGISALYEPTAVTEIKVVAKKRTSGAPQPPAAAKPQ